MDNKFGRWLRVEAVTSRTLFERSETSTAVVNLDHVVRVAPYRTGTIFHFSDMNELVTVEDFGATCSAIKASELPIPPILR